MADCSLSSWSETASTLQHGRSNSEYSNSQYSYYSEPEKTSERPVPSADAPWVISYLLESGTPDELPLRVMFSFNSGQALPSLRDAHKYWYFQKEGQKIIHFLSSLEKITPTIADASAHDFENPAEALTNTLAPHCPYDRFMDPGNEHLLKSNFIDVDASPGRRSSQGLPPNVVHKLLLSTMFRMDYSDVDFQQALTGLDYLRDIEETRRCSQREAAGRLGITYENWRDVLLGDRSALDWVEKVLENETIIEGYYARISVNLRIWTMVNELRQPRFYKPNVLAMLNTLFPPSVGELPNRGVLASVIHGHRASLYHIMVAVESGNRKPLEAFVAKHLSLGTSYSWSETRSQLENYLELAESMISHAHLITGIDSIPPLPERSPERINRIDSHGSSPRQSQDISPHSSFDGEDSMPGTPHVSSSSSIFRPGHSRGRSRTIIIPNFDEPLAIRSAPLADTTPYTPRPTLTSPGTGFTGSSANTPLGYPQSSSPPKHRSFTLGSDPFEGASLEPGSLARNYSDVDNFMSSGASTTRTSTEHVELRHRRTNSSGKPRISHSAKASLELRPRGLRRDSSALRHVESVEDRTPPKETPFLGRIDKCNPPETPNLDTRKMDRRPSLGESLLRKVKSTTFIRDTPSSVESTDVTGSLLLTRQSSSNVGEMDSGYNSLRKSTTRSRNDTFGRRSTNPWRPSTARGNNPLGIMFGASTESFMSYNGENLTKVVTPLEVNEDFISLKSEKSSRPTTPLLRHHSSFAHLKESTSSTTLGFREQLSTPSSPVPVDLNQPFNAYPVPGKDKDIILKNPDLKNKRSTSFLEMRRSKSNFHANKTPTPIPYIPTSEFASGSPFIGLDAAMKSKLKKKSSMPTMAFLSSKNSKPKTPTVDDGILVYETNDPNERLIMTQTNSSTPSLTLRKAFTPTQSKPPTPTTPTMLTTPAQRLRMVKSQAELSTDRNKKDRGSGSYFKTPTKRLFRKFSREQILTSADISEPFPDELRKSLSNNPKAKSTASSKAKSNSSSSSSSKSNTLSKDSPRDYNVPTAILKTSLEIPMPSPSFSVPYAPGGTRPLTHNYIPPTTETLEDFTRKEYTRKWFLEESRARRFELEGPEGGPVVDGGVGCINGTAWPRAKRREVVKLDGEGRRRRFRGLFSGQRGREELVRKGSGYEGLETGVWDRY